jgi:hypothetical protein
MDDMEFHQGSRAGYYWLTSREDYSGSILRACPEVFVDRYLVVTCVDGGAVRLSPNQFTAGWEIRRGIGYSPRLACIDDVPHQIDGRNAPGYDEFYTFEAPCDLGERSEGNMFLEQFAPAPGRTVVFVQWMSFVLHSPDSAVQTLVDLFWPQLLRLEPESYIADGTECLTFVSRNKELFDLVHDRLTSS